jgi:hypothetical protein
MTAFEPGSTAIPSQTDSPLTRPSRVAVADSLSIRAAFGRSALANRTAITLTHDPVRLENQR